MIRLMRMNAVALKVRNLKQSSEWYQRHFGFQYRGSAEGCIVIGVGDIELVLSPHDNPEAPLADPRKERCIHTLAFEVSKAEFHKLHREFEAEDGGIVNVSQEGFESIITSDPDGYCVELYYNKTNDNATG